MAQHALKLHFLNILVGTYDLVADLQHELKRDSSLLDRSHDSSDVCTRRTLEKIAYLRVSCCLQRIRFADR